MKSASQIRWKEIMSQWSEQFPFLKPYGTMRLLYRTDIFMIGLYLEKLRGPVYLVEFEVKQLWEPPVTNWPIGFMEPVHINAAQDQTGLKV